MSNEAPGDYDPSEAFGKEQERKERAAETRRIKSELDESSREAMREARAEESPETVKTYQSVFGRFPKSWPPDPYGNT